MSDEVLGSERAARWPILLLALGFVLLLAVGGLTVWIAQENKRQNDDIEHTLEVQAANQRLLTELLNAETGQRGYLLVGRTEYYRVYVDGLRAVPLAYRRLREMTRDNPRQQANLARVAPMVRQRLERLRVTTALMSVGQADQAIALVRQGLGKRLMDRIRVEISRIDAEEARLLRERRARAERTVDQLMLAAIVGLFLAITLGIAAVTAMRRSARGLERANAQVRRLNEGLEDLVAERTADLTEANEEIQRFAYIVSHDLRSPLVNVMGFTSELDAARAQASDLLDRVEEERPGLATRDQQLAIREDLPEALGFIRTSTAKMDRLINAILKLSREGRRTLAPERIDLTRLLRDIADALHQQTSAADAVITVDPLPELVSDRLALDQVFGNLVENAVKYLAPGRPGRVNIRGKRLNSRVEVVVEDNGRGIDSADQERVFDLFRRAGAQDKPGEGIGLAHVRALVRRLGGTITLESELGRGSRFTVNLPVTVKEGSGE